MQFETCIQNTKLLAGTLFFISTTSNPSPGLPKLLLLFCQLNLICVLFRVRIITCLANYVSLHFSIIKSNSSNVPRGPHKMLEMPLLGELSGIEGIYFIHWRCVHFFPLLFILKLGNIILLLPSEQACCLLYLVLFMDSPITIHQYCNWFMTFTPISRITGKSVKRLYMKISFRV